MDTMNDWREPPSAAPRFMRLHCHQHFPPRASTAYKSWSQGCLHRFLLFRPAVFTWALVSSTCLALFVCFRRPHIRVDFRLSRM